MRRRLRAGRPESDAELVAFWRSTVAEAQVIFNDAEDRRSYVNAVLADRGCDVVDAIRARRALRR